MAAKEQPGFSAARAWVTEEMGNETTVVLAAGDHKITARAPAESRLDFDSEVWYRFKPEKVHRFDRVKGIRL